MLIEIYTDGACDKNPGGNGGWAAVLVVDGVYKGQWSGCGFETTNQRMELTAAINGIKETMRWIDSNTQDAFLDISLYSDSAYLVNCVKQHWWAAWLINGWKNSKKEPVANQDLWMELVPHFQSNFIQFKKLKGHSGNQWNEFVDDLAVSARLVAKELSEIEKVSNKESNQRN